MPTTVSVTDDAFCVDDGESAEINVNTVPPKTLNVRTENYVGDVCSVSMSMDAARKLRAWLNALDLEDNDG